MTEKDPAPFSSEFSKRYRVVECFSHNEISETYLVCSLENGKEYVAKIYERFFVEGGADERKILADLNHPAVPKLIDSIETDEHVYVIREYIEGNTLEKTQIPVGERFALNVGVQLCDCLTYLHTQTPPIIHRDIKPQNIVIDGENKISLIDFGIARRFCDTSEKDTYQMVSNKYSPPEQYGCKQTDSLSDIYSLGIVLCRLLTGSFDILETESLKNPALAKVVQKCAAFDPKNRYKTAEMVKRALIRACGKNKSLKYAALSAVAAVLITGGFILGRWSVRPVIAPIGESENLPPVYESESPAQITERNEQITDPVYESESIVTERYEQITDPVYAGVSFKEPLIEAAVRFVLDLDEDDEITGEQLYLIKEIHIENNRVFKDTGDYHQNHSDPEYNAVYKPLITSLEDLRFMPNLEVVRIGFQNITNIEPLSELTHLRVLGLLHNPVTDFSPLQSLVFLRDINITSSLINDLSPFYGLSRLEMLVLNDCLNYDSAQLLELPQYIKQLAVLGHIDAYKNLPDIQIDSLTLSKSGFDSLEYIAPFKSSLRDLWIYETELTSLDGIEEFTRLEVLDIRHLQIDDLSPLLELPYLRYLGVSESMRSAVEIIEDRAGFEINLQ